MTNLYRKCRLRRGWRVAALAFALLLPCVAVGQAAPRVERVEPPDWWPDVLPDLMVLLTGENLSGASVNFAYPGVRVARTEAQPEGRYLFVWLEIAPGTQPGVVSLAVRTPGGSASVEFSLHPRLPRAGNFQGLSPDDVIYLIMPDRFANGDASNDQPAESPGTHDRNKARAYHGGDLLGIRQRLPYLRDLGVTSLWLNPIYDNDNSSPNDYHGYGAVDYYAVDEHLGTLRDFQELVRAAHHQGIKIFLDNVPNHCGPRHRWVKFSPQPDWFHGTAEQHLTSRSPFDHLTDAHAPPRFWRDIVEGWFAGVLPDLNQENPQVSRYLLQNSIWWAEQTGLDGYRLDTFPYVGRRFWSEWHRELFRLYPNFATIGEVFHHDVSVTSFFGGGRTQNDGIDSRVTTVFDFPFYMALREVVLREAPVKRLVDVLQRDWLYAHPKLLVTFLGNHDVRRLMSEPGASWEKLKLGFSLLFTVRGVPQLYAGDEIGMEGGEDPDNRRDFPGGWPNDARDAFTAAGRSAPEQKIFEHVRTLLALRKQHLALRRGRHWHLAWDAGAYVFARQTPEECLLIVFNNSEQPWSGNVPLSDTPLAASSQLEPLFASSPATIQNGQARLQANPTSLAIYRVK